MKAFHPPPSFFLVVAAAVFLVLFTVVFAAVLALVLVFRPVASEFAYPACAAPLLVVPVTLLVAPAVVAEVLATVHPSFEGRVRELSFSSSPLSRHRRTSSLLKLLLLLLLLLLSYFLSRVEGLDSLLGTSWPCCPDAP